MKKRNDYTVLLVFQVLLALNGIVIMKLPENGIDFPSTAVSRVLQGIVGIGFLIYLYRVISNFYTHKILRIFCLLLLIAEFILFGYLSSSEGVRIENLKVLGVLNFSTCICHVFFVFYIILKDIFLNRHDLTYGLLGAANIYFMIAILFAYLYSLIGVFNPSMVLAASNDFNQVFENSILYSFYILVGIDFPNQEISNVIKNLSIFEAASSNLFIVFIVGRLMTKD